ncbi:MAG: chemotaxis protein CheC [Nanobdellota archaeon]
MTEFNIPDFLNDCLKELANVGGGHATGALSQLLSRKVNLGVPYIRFVLLNQLKEKQLEEGEKIVAVYSKVHDETIGGNLIVTFPWKSSQALKMNMLSDGLSQSEEITHEDEIKFREVGDALFQSYAEAINNFLALNLKYSESKFILSTPHTLMDLIVEGTNSEYALVVSTKFDVDGMSIDGDLELSFIPQELEIFTDVLKKNFGMG